ncbi:hypothetical protein DYBT9275_02358 [Dyadobacter sp. CECT 9275]|uniref:DUF4890 domain-containing protein n=1 Tax=Dyadobacter helix TaxID=2822344 RepID=A0A916NC70_9BACT|nr:hypothetical protein [Dyadobacter sp. CECT 9275]CAG4999977.1 hypothetical protein DYBT9275_02358 [Dyadobacter sp. CECT 9275]
MKKTKVIILLIASFVLVMSKISAQSTLKELPADERAKMLTEKMTASLKLDSVQVVKVGDINLKYARKIDPVIKGNGSRMSKLKAFRDINQEKQAELRKVLSKEQFGQYQKMQEEMRDRIRQR